MPEINVIICVEKNYGIGKNGFLPWNIREELKIFKEKTLNNIVIVGRKTLETLPFLKDRTVYCISSLYKFGVYNSRNPDAKIFSNIEDAMASAILESAVKKNKIFVIGGNQIYNFVFKNYYNSLIVHLSYISKQYNCDTYFDQKNLNNFYIISSASYDEFIHYEMKYIKHGEIQYRNLILSILKNGNERITRNGKTISDFGKHLKFDLREGFPLLTTKKMFIKGVIEELLFFIRGETNSKILEEKGINIWNGNTNRQFLDKNGFEDRKEGEMGPMYGAQWRHFNSLYNEEKGIYCDYVWDDMNADFPLFGVDQLQNLVSEIKINPYSRRILLTSFNPAQVDLGVLYPCFMEDTIILTEKGYKFIQDVNIDDKLFTHLGNFKPINHIQKTIYSKGNIFELKIAHHPHIIKTTPEHPFYVKEIKFINKRGKTIGYEASDPKWIEAQNLKINHYIGMKINKLSIIPSFTFIKNVNQYKTKTVYKILNNPDEWFLLGYFLGDGWCDFKRQSIFQLVFCDKDEKLITDLLKKLNIPFNFKKYKNNNKCKTVVCTNFILWNILIQFGHLAHNKYIPEWVQNAPIEYINEFIKGYTKADGSVKSIRTNFTTVSKNIAFGLQRLYLKLNKILHVIYQKRKPTCVIQGRTVKQRNTYKLDLSNNIKTSSFYILEDDYIWYKIRNIEEIIYMDPINVYNFDVEDDHTYCVQNLLVHNCHSIIIQFYVQDQFLDMFCYNRSNDVGLGSPFNIASTSLLLMIISKITNLIPRYVNITIGDAHIYLEHVEALKLQVERKPYAWPNIILPDIECLEDVEKLTYEDFKLVNYNFYPTVKMPMIA